MIIFHHLANALLEIHGGHDRLIGLQRHAFFVFMALGVGNHHRIQAVAIAVQKIGKNYLRTVARPVLGKHATDGFGAAAKVISCPKRNVSLMNSCKTFAVVLTTVLS